MDLSIYDVILGPVMTDKAYKLNRNLKKLVLRVHSQANKPMVKEAIEQLFDVKVKNIRMMIRKGKVHRYNRREVQKPSSKKAIITLKEGYSVDLWDHQPGAAVSPPESAGKAGNKVSSKS